ncbi:hypothetical protein E2C01_053380 [Portunus trituberculatus]|uniref:Uncharacterized protein n=1 Tax=Portunus trituberculatus TaxID=210409 RepID=A0A5B7GK60_PORTR|nr:hypothetical protein [Portunus trituberculatus]
MSVFCCWRACSELSGQQGVDSPYSMESGPEVTILQQQFWGHIMFSPRTAPHLWLWVIPFSGISGGMTDSITSLHPFGVL